MTAEDKDSLRVWAKNWHEGIFLVQGRQVLELLAENEQLEAIADQRGREVRQLKDELHRLRFWNTPLGDFPG